MEYVIMVFLLFFAVLAFGWFYLQRAKARDAAKADSVASAAPAAQTTSETTTPTAADEPQS